MSAEDTSWRRWNRFGLASGAPSGEAEVEVEESPSAAPVHPDMEDVQPISGTFVAAGAHFEGTLRLEGDFFIDSEFRGELDTDGKLVVGPGAAIEGDIRAREVVICGAVVGNVTARRQLILRATARLHGDIETACLEVEPHAFFRGSTMMTRPQDHMRRTPTPAEPAAQATAATPTAAPAPAVEPGPAISA